MRVLPHSQGFSPIRKLLRTEELLLVEDVSTFLTVLRLLCLTSQAKAEKDKG